MPIRGPSWYNLQSTKRYPLDERATGTGDKGERLKDDILVDCHLRWPRSHGQYAYVGGLTVTPNVVTVVILAADTVEATSGFTPLAVLSIPQPVNRHVHYPVEPMQPGVGGFLVFGDTSEGFVSRFSLPEQGLLAPRCARPYEDIPVTSLRKLGRATGLVDVIKLLAGSDVEVVKETHEIQGLEREALVIRLVQQIANRNVLEVYRGECDNRPESRTCNKEGIETINDVLPDCDGNINIVFEGVTPSPYDNCGESLAAGVTIDQDIGIAQVCADRTPGRFTGTDLCAATSSSSADELPSESSASVGPVDSTSSSEASVPSISSEACDPLPLIVTFDDAEAEGFDVTIGNFIFEEFDSPAEVGDPDAVCYSAFDTSRRNVSVLEHCSIGTTWAKRVKTHVALVASDGKPNGGLILNYHLVQPLSNPHIEYFIVLLDRQAGKVRLLRWAGAGFIEETAATVGAPFIYDDWYSIQADITNAGSGNVAIDVTVEGITNPAWPAINFSVLSSRYLPADGKFGVGSDRGHARFSFLSVEDV